MRKTKQILLSLLALAGMVSLPANADLNQKQVGVPNMTGTFGSTTSEYPVYTMDKYGQGINFYQKAAIGLESGVIIKEISFLGFQGEKDFTDATITVYLANTTSTNYMDFVMDGPKEGSASTTVFNPENATLFYEGSFEQPAAGEKGSPVKIFDIVSEEGFEYGGENLMVYIFLNTPKAASYATFYAATASGTTFKSFGAKRSSNYTPEQYNGGYSVFTKSWSLASGTPVPQVPVMTIGYEGQAQKITATVSGSVKSGLNGSILGAATVELYAGEELLESTVSASNGKYSFTVDEVDVTAVYTVKASKEGYTEQSTTVDLKAGGAVNVPDLTLPKLPVPATLSGYVVNKATSQPVADVAISFNGENKVSGEDGSYSFSVENVDVLPYDGVALTATAPGYYDYSTSLRIKEDMEFNIELNPLAALPGEGAQVGEYTITDYDYNAPFNTLWQKSVTETIYPKEMLGNLTEGEKYSSISFYGYVPSSTPAPDPDEGDDNNDDDYGYGDYGFRAPAKADAASYTYDITIYMVDTEETGFTATSEGEDYSSYTKLYEGPVTMTEGGSKTEPKLLFTANLNRPYVYGGDNVKLIVVSNSKSSKLIYFAMDPAVKANILSKTSTNNLEEASWKMVNTGVPVFKLGDYVPTAEVNGTVTDKAADAPLKGVEVTMSYDTDTYTATTDAEGKYTLFVRNVAFEEDYVITVSYLDYDEITDMVSFTEDEMVKTLDFELVQPGEISGIVTDGETGDPIEGATVTLLNGEDEIETTTTDASGAYSFTFDEVEYHEYTVKVEAEKYITGTLTVQLTAETPKVDNANIVLNDIQSGVEEIMAGDDANDVYSVSGVLVKRNATSSDMKDLAKGVYIVGKKKVIVK